MKLQIGRRGFLGLLGAAAGWLATKPMRALVSIDAPAPIPIDVTKVTIGQWADYWPPPEGLIAAHDRQALATFPLPTPKTEPVYFFYHPLGGSD